MKRLLLFLALSLMMATSALAQENLSYKKGYQGNVEISNGLVFGKDRVGSVMQLTSVHGGRFGNGMYLGAGLGLGYNLTLDEIYVPLFLDAKYNFLDASVSPFAAVRTGCCLGGMDGFCLTPFVSVGAGVDFGRFSVRLGYEYDSQRYEIFGYHDSSNVVTLSKSSKLVCAFSFNF